jgi:hypothetical protein
VARPRNTSGAGGCHAALLTPCSVNQRSPQIRDIHSDPHQGPRLLRLNLQERAMHGSELPPLVAPPISITCSACRNEMRLASIDPTDEKAVYTYECANGHQLKISTADPTSIRGTPTVQPTAGPAPPEPWEIFSAVRKTSLPLSTVAHRDWPAIYLRRVLRPGS